MFDVIIVGGGPAGCAAALGAAKSGSKVLLIERNNFLGGTGTSVGVSSIAPFHYGKHQMIKGVGNEIMEELFNKGGSTWFLESSNEYGTGAAVTIVNREIYKYVLFNLMRKYGIKLMLNTYLTGVELSHECSKIKSIYLAGKSGKEKVSGKAFIDATGDGDIARKIGIPYTIGRISDGLTQPLTLIFEMSNVDLEKLEEYIFQNPTDFEWTNKLSATRNFPSNYNQRHFVAQGFKNACKWAESKGLFFGRNSILVHTSILPNTVSFNSTRVIKKLGIKTSDITSATEESFHQMMNIVELLNEGIIPGFEKATLSFSSNTIGVRETIHVQGKYTLTMDDVINGKHFDDCVAKGVFPIDIHSVTGTGGYDKGSIWKKPIGPYDIPLRCLLPVYGPENLVISGRAISVDHYAHGSVRTSGTIFGIGHASGVVAAHIAECGSANLLEYSKVKNSLLRQNAVL